MNEKSHPSRHGPAALTAVAIAFAAGVGLYAFLPGSGNDAGAACAGSLARAATLEPFVKGDVAAFQIAASANQLGDLAFKDGEGKDAALSRWNGKTVLLNLWATWCAPCRHEMPALDRLEGAMGGENFQVVPVSVDLGDDTKPKAFFKKTGLEKLPFYADGTMGIFNNLKQRGLAFGMPSTILIGGDGCALGVLNGPAEWDGGDAKALIAAAVG